MISLRGCPRPHPLHPQKPSRSTRRRIRAPRSVADWTIPRMCMPSAPPAGLPASLIPERFSRLDHLPPVPRDRQGARGAGGPAIACGTGRRGLYFRNALGAIAFPGRNPEAQREWAAIDTNPSPAGSAMPVGLRSPIVLAHGLFRVSSRSAWVRSPSHRTSAGSPNGWRPGGKPRRRQRKLSPIAGICASGEGAGRADRRGRSPTSRST